MNTTDKLAEALRLAREWFRHEEAGEGPQADDVIKAADEAITAHDAEQAQEAQQPAGRASVDDWERELSAVMPADFKDWWQNSRREWPAVAAEVIKSLRRDRDAGWEVAARAQRREPLTDEQIEPKAHAGEPVVPYLYVYEYDSPFGLNREFYPSGWNGQKPTRTVPLYTTPQPALAQRREPLTDAEIEEILHGEIALNPGEGCAGRFARAIERAHGIGATTGEQR